MMRAVPKIEDLKTKMGTNNELTFSAQGAYCVACSTNGVFEDIPKQECSLGKYVYSTNTQMLKEQKYRYIMSSKVGRSKRTENKISRKSTFNKSQLPFN